METTKYLNLECIPLENRTIQLLVTRSVGPRIISLKLKGSSNLLAELPDFVSTRPDGVDYHFYGGHRLWMGPEDHIRSYALDDFPLEISQTGAGLICRKPVEQESGLEKSMEISLAKDDAKLTITHRLTNRGAAPMECAPWTITQLKPGGVAILPQTRSQTGLLPNRVLSFWPYADIASPHLSLGNRFILLRAGMQTPFKVGFPNPRGWLAYWLDGTLFVKRAPFDPQARYCDFGSSSECYCNNLFLELETLAPLGMLAPNATATHVEIWELYPNVDPPMDEDSAQAIVEKLGLE
jgi:hypothetical protein